MIRKRDNIIIVILSMLFTLATRYDYKISSLNGSLIFNILYFLFVVLIFSKVWKKLIKLNLKIKKQKFKKVEFILYACIFFVPVILAMIAYYPTVGHCDSYYIWNIANENILDNWHPLIYELIFFKIPSLFSNNIYSTLILQLAFEFVTLMYLCYFCRKKYLNFYQTFIVFGLLCINPVFIKFSVHVAKDMPFMCCILLATLYLINIVDSDTKWLDKKENKIVFILSSIGILTLRHNGIASFVVMFLYLIKFFLNKRKYILKVFFAIIIPFFIITGPMYRIFKVLIPDSKYEMIGIPMGNIAYYYNNNVEFSNKDKFILYQIISEENWRDCYNPRNFNNIKWAEGTQKFYIESQGKFNDLLNIWWKHTVRNPELFLKSYLNMTSPIWEIKQELHSFDSYVWCGELSNTEYRVKLRNFLNSYNSFLEKTPFRWLIINFGEGLFIIIVSILLVIKKTDFNLQKLVPFIPTMINTITIMFLITGEEYRFFLSQIVCYIPLLLFGISTKKRKNKK